ncbi:MAG TPA: SDR family oxidoreductase [Acidimicrobiales bacterium]|nr:SDR family oxidoreductase [Acidimicrobiales bacterium]
MNRESGATKATVVVVSGPATGLADRLASRLAEGGHPVGFVSPHGAETRAESVRAAGGKAIGVAAPPGDRAALDAALSRCAELGPTSTVVLAFHPASAAQSRELMSLSADEWDHLCEAPIRACLVGLQSAHQLLSGSGGSVVVVVPTVALVGADGHVTATTAGEAQRILAKSAARRWGISGITVNVAAVPLDTLDDGAGGPPGAAQLSLGPPALPPGDPAIGIASLVDALAGGLDGMVTGATVCLDSGAVMAP